MLLGVLLTDSYHINCYETSNYHQTIEMIDFKNFKGLTQYDLVHLWLTFTPTTIPKHLTFTQTLQ